MNDEKNMIASLIAIMFAGMMLKLLPKKEEEPPISSAAAGIRILGINGNEVPPIGLEPGEYAVEVTVTNKSIQYGELVAVEMKTGIEAVINGIELISPTYSVDEYDPGEEKILTWSLSIHEDLPMLSGSIIVKIFDLNDVKVAEAHLPIEITGPRREAFNGMGDLNDDGYVSFIDILILDSYRGGAPIHEISPLSETEFLRRADFNGDGIISLMDKVAFQNFIDFGFLGPFYHFTFDYLTILEVPYGDPIELVPGEYTVEATISGYAFYACEQVGTNLQVGIEAGVNETTLLLPDRVDKYWDAGQTRIITWTLIVPEDIGEKEGSVTVRVYRPPLEGYEDEYRLILFATLPIRTIPGPTIAINGLGDLNDDGFVTQEDEMILQLFLANQAQIMFGMTPLSSITTANIPLWEFARRAELNCDGIIDNTDAAILHAVVEHGNHMIPVPVYAPRQAINNMGDLEGDGYVNSISIFLVNWCAFGAPPSVLSPLSIEDFLHRADMNSDGRINSGDIQAMILFMTTGYIPTYVRADIGINVS